MMLTLSRLSLSLGRTAVRPYEGNRFELRVFKLDR